MQRFFRIDRRTVQRVFILTAIFFFAAHLYRFTGTNFSHDSLQIFQQTNAEFQFSLGRFMQPIYWKLRGQVVVPYLIGLLSFLFLAAALCLVSDLLRLTSRLSIALCCMALCANSTLALANGTFISWLDVYMLSFLLSVVSVFLCVRLRWGFLLAPIPLCMMLGLYQSYLQTAILLFLFCLLHDLLDSRVPPPEKILAFSAKALFTLIAGLLLYAIANHLILSYKGIELGTEYNSIRSVGQYAGFSIPALIRDTYLYPFSYMSSPQTHFPRLACALYMLVWVIGLFCLFRLARKNGMRLPAAIMTALILFLLPLGANAVYFISKGIVHTLMIYSFFFAFVLPVSLIERAIREDALPAPRKAVCTSLVFCAFSLTFLSDVIFCNQLYLRRDLEYQSTLSLFTRVIDRAEQVDGYQPGFTPVALIGTLFDTPLFLERDGFDSFSSMLGTNNVYATTSPTDYPWYFWHILGYPFNLVSNFERDQWALREDVLAMPAFPAKGSCQMIDGTMVIRLGNRSVAD